MPESDVVFDVLGEYPEPVPAKEMTPDWFKYLPATTNIESNSDGREKPVSTVSLCRPFIDAMKVGVTVRAPFTVEVDSTSDSVTVTAPGEQENITVLTPSEPRNSGNSSFALPDVLLDLPYRLKTSSEYISLITKPLNKEVAGVRPFSMVVSGNGETRDLSTLLTFEEESVVIEKGDPLFDILFLPRDSLLTSYDIQNFAEHSERRDAYNEFRELKEARGNDFYRLHYWEQKDSPVISNACTNTPIESNSSPRVDPVVPMVSEGSDGMLFGVAEQWYNVIPSPVPAHERIPDRYRNLQSLIGGERGEELQQWVLNAMRLGVLGLLTAELEFAYNDAGEIETDTHFPDQILWDMSEELLRKTPNGGVNPVNWNSQWVCSTPDGYSALFTEPFNHFQQHVRAFSGVVENDQYPSTANTPSEIVSDAMPIHLDRGTAMFQYIPIKRDALGVSIDIRSFEPP